MKTIATIVLSFVLALSAQSQPTESFSKIIPEKEADQLFQQADQKYADGEYSQAIDLYEQLVAAQYESAVLYYNLGNAYFKTQDYPSAILYYERAKRIAPDDPDINFNLELSQRHTIDKIEPLPAFLLTRWVRSLRSLFNADGWAMLSVGSFVLLLVLGSLFLYSRSPVLKKTSFAVAILALLFSVVSLIFARQQYYRAEKLTEAIIFAPTVTVKSSPSETGTDIFPLHEGTKVTVIDSLKTWRKIKLKDGKVGWLENSTMKEI